MHADGADFGIAYPDSRAFRNAPGLDTEIGQGIDHGLFDCPHIRPHIALPLAQVQDGISDNLSRPVIGDVAAPVGGVEGDTGAGQAIFAG